MLSGFIDALGLVGIVYAAVFIAYFHPREHQGLWLDRGRASKGLLRASAREPDKRTLLHREQVHLHPFHGKPHFVSCDQQLILLHWKRYALDRHQFLLLAALTPLFFVITGTQWFAIGSPTRGSGVASYLEEVCHSNSSIPLFKKVAELSTATDLFSTSPFLFLFLSWSMRR